MDDPALAAVTALERRLHEPAVRADRAALDELLHPSFAEIGASGRRWTRPQMIEELSSHPQLDPIDMTDVEIDELADGVALITYATATAQRSSLWVRHDGRWRIRYHQGTPNG